VVLTPMCFNVFFSEQDFSLWPFRSGRFRLADSVWPIRSGRFGLGLFALSCFGLSRFGLSRFDHGTNWSDYETLQKSYINAKTSRLIQSALPPSSYCRLPTVEAFNSKRTAFTIRKSDKRCRQGMLLGIKFLVVVQSN